MWRRAILSAGEAEKGRGVGARKGRSKGGKGRDYVVSSTGWKRRMMRGSRREGRNRSRYEKKEERRRGTRGEN